MLRVSQPGSHELNKWSNCRMLYLKYQWSQYNYWPGFHSFHGKTTTTKKQETSLNVYSNAGPHHISAEHLWKWKSKKVCQWESCNYAQDVVCGLPLLLWKVFNFSAWNMEEADNGRVCLLHISSWGDQDKRQLVVPILKNHLTSQHSPLLQLMMATLSNSYSLGLQLVKSGSKRDLSNK